MRSKTRPILFIQLALMAALLVYALIFPESFLAFIERPELYTHAKFIHILSVTLFFSNAVIGTIWETRSLLSKNPEIIRYTYKTVVWLDAVFTAPCILLAVLSGIMLGTILGGVWTMGWLSTAFTIFLFSGVVWVLLDIPTQYRANRLFESVGPEIQTLPLALTRLLWWRMGLNLVTILPLLFIFFLMVHKPEMARVSSWLRSVPGIKVSVARPVQAR